MISFAFEMNDLLLRLLTLLGALGLFIYGMKVMSEGIQRFAGAKMRRILEALTRNRAIGLVNGFLLTGLIQSSTAVTILTVGLVHAGLLTVMESMAFIMGANIGTTITGWIVSVLGLQVKLHLLALPMIALALPLLFRRQGTWSYGAQALIGLALLFLGLEYLRSSFPDLSTLPALMDFLRRFSDLGFSSILLYVLFGFVLTGLVQSSSATMALILVMSANGWLSFHQGAALLLGANVGTAITANLAALVGNTLARRAALFHLLFNAGGLLWMLPLLGVFLSGTDWFCRMAFQQDSAFREVEAIPLALSAFHTAFNLLNALIFLFLIPLVHRLLSWLLPLPGGGPAPFQLRFLDASVNTPELHLFEAQKAVGQLGSIAAGMVPQARALLLNTTAAGQQRLLEQIQQDEQYTDRMEKEILAFLGQLSAGEIRPDLATQLGRYQRICKDLERIADLTLDMADSIDQKNRTNTWFSPGQRASILPLFDFAAEALQEMQRQLHRQEQKAKSDSKHRQLQEKIRAYCRQLRTDHLAATQEEDYRIPAGLIYHNLIAHLERISDHAFNVIRALEEGQV